MRKVVFSFVFVICALSLVHSQSVYISFDKDSILIGDHLLLDVQVDLVKKGQIYLPDLDSLWAFEFIEVKSSDTTALGLHQEIIITNFDEGVYQFGPLPVLVQQADGGIDTMFSNTPLLFVNTIPVDTSQVIKPIKPLLLPDFPWKKVLPKVLIPLVGIALFIALVAFIIWWREKRRKNAIKPKAMIDYYYEAKDRLQKLERKQLWQKGHAKEYYLGMSEILRMYVEGRFGVQAMELTTEETIQELIVADGLKGKLEKVLIQADFAKYAKFKPKDEENKMMMKLAQDFVSHTKPQDLDEIKEENV